MDDAYERLLRRMNSPWIVIDNECCSSATAIRIVSSSKRGRLLEIVQILTDLNLVVTKAYISSDGVWFMDVFYVIDRDGKKVQDAAATDGITDSIKKSLAGEVCLDPYIKESSVGVAACSDYTSIELSGTDRPGLLSDVSAVLTNLDCSIISAEVWTHNRRAAAVICLTEMASVMAIKDSEKLLMIEELLGNLVKGGGGSDGGARTMVSCEAIHVERRLHQMMFADRDYERSVQDPAKEMLRLNVTIANRGDKDYSVVIIRCKDRPNLLFDTICTLTDMQYAVFHGNVDAAGSEAYQEYYIRHIDGSPLGSEAEKQRVIRCLEAAIERRAHEGLKLELRTSDGIGLLSHVTRIFRENGLSVTRAQVSTRAGKAIDTFYVREASGHGVDSRTVDAVREAIGVTILQVKDNGKNLGSSQEPRSLFGDLFKSRSFCNFSLIRP